MRAIDEHRKLSRIAISFNPKLDEEFKINVPKMRVQLPSALKEDIEKWIRPSIKLAEEVYRKGKPNSSSAPTNPTSKPPTVPAIPPLLPSNTNPPKFEVNGQSRATKQELDVVADLLLQVAEPAEVTVIENAVARARKKLENQ